MEITLTAEARTGAGKGVARKLRASGKVPAVLYGAGADAEPLAVEARAIAAALATDAGLNVLIDLKVGAETYLTLARELQRDPLRGTITHVDFLKIDRNKTIEVTVPIRMIGSAPGVKEGGVIEHHLWDVRVECLPMNVPEHLDADISSLGLPSHLRVADLALPDGVRLLSEPEETVLSVVVPQALKLEEPTAAAEGEEAAAAGEAASGESASEGEDKG